jgi:Cu/Ag efflux pump CusA
MRSFRSPGSTSDFSPFIQLSKVTSIPVGNGALRRLRPIVMTFAVIVAGLTPIMYGSGTGAEVMRRIAAPMVGGMISATVLALVVVPVVYFVLRRRSLESRPHKPLETNVQ